MNPKGEVLCVGRLYVDVVMTGLRSLPALGREQYAREVTIVPGGGAFITAAHLRALGAPARLAAALGDDPVSASVEAHIRAAGLDLALIERFAGGPQITVALAVDQDRAFTTRRIGPSAPASLRGHLGAGGVRHVHVGELATLVDHPWLPEAARRVGATLSIDIAWDDEIFRDSQALDLATSADLVFPNADEAAALTGIAAARKRDLLAAFTSRGAAVALKCGSEGALFSDGDTALEAAALPGPVLDATGAGDAFDAGFLESWIAGRPPAICLARAIACGAHATRRIGGAADLPTPDQIEEMSRSVQVRTVGMSIDA
jgi:sugar/nucleoside kinase (ribokinase family)